MQISKQRLEEVRKEIAALKDKLNPLEMRHSKDKARREEISRLQNKRKELLEKLEIAEMRRDSIIAADLRFAYLELTLVFFLDFLFKLSFQLRIDIYCLILFNLQHSRSCGLKSFYYTSNILWSLMKDRFICSSTPLSNESGDSHGREMAQHSLSELLQDLVHLRFKIQLKV